MTPEDFNAAEASILHGPLQSARNMRGGGHPAAASIAFGLIGLTQATLLQARIMNEMRESRLMVALDEVEVAEAPQ